MNIFIDLQGMQTVSRWRGIGRYTQDLINAILSEATINDEIHLGWNNIFEPPIERLNVLNGDSKVVSAPYGALTRKRFSLGMFDIQHDINDALFRDAVSLSTCKHVLFSSLMEADEPNFTLPRHLNFSPNALTYVVAFDIIPHLFKDIYLSIESFAEKYYAHLHVLCSADIILAISEQTRIDIIKEFDINPESVVTIGAGIDLETFRSCKTPSTDFLRKFCLEKPYIFFTGGDEYRKNLDGLTQAIAMLATDIRHNIQLLVAGKVSEQKQQGLKSWLASVGLAAETVIYGGYLSNEDLLAAYEFSAVTVIPSLYEGFGLPALEAMACKSALLVSNNSGLSEIVKDERFSFNPKDISEIAKKIEFVLKNSNEVTQFKSSYPSILKKYSWPIVAKRALKAMKDAETRLEEKYLASKSSEAGYIDCFIPTYSHKWNNLINDVASKNIVTVYTLSKNVFYFKNVSASIDSISGLDYRIDKTTPIITIIDSLEGLLCLCKIKNLSDHIVLVEKVFWDRYKILDLTVRQKKTIELASEPWAIWLYKDSHCQKLDNSNLNSLNEQESTLSFNFGNDFAKMLRVETERFRATHPQFLAKKLQAIIERHGGKSSLNKQISRAASVSRFNALNIK